MQNNWTSNNNGNKMDTVNHTANREARVFEPYPIAKYIPFKWTSLIDDKGVFHKSFNAWDAKKIADEVGLQLVCFKEANGPENPFCKIINFGKWKYENEKNKKKQSTHSKHEAKEIWISPNIENHDLQHKLNKVKEFIHDGNEVNLFLKVEGRDLQHMDIAQSKFDEVIIECAKFSKILDSKKQGNRFWAKLLKV